MKKSICNPYLPIDVYIPDGEPHVFGDRIYIFGSHDKEGGEKFCMLDYEVFSAPCDDLSDWRSHGVIYRAEQDPDYSEKYRYMYAPDVVCGNDGRYYLYYAMSGEGVFTGPIKVAVCDAPAGKYEYLGAVKNKDGSVFDRNITFDPAVINDDGTIRLYYGWALAPGRRKLNKKAQDKLLEVEEWLFGKTKEQILSEPQGLMGAFTVTLADDMLTVTGEPLKILPGQLESADTKFEKHAFFEASSVRKIGGKYYFIYSSENQHELCYATSKYPDRDFEYGGVIISNGDIGYRGREEKDRLAATGNNHGSIEKINDQWYVFYHRQTHKTSFSRQGCAEKIYFDTKGRIAQVEMTSCGLNGESLIADGTYSATVCCNLTNGNMPHIEPDKNYDIPHITNDGDERFITGISDGTLIGFKYIYFTGMVSLKLKIRGDAGEVKITVGNQISTVGFGSSESWRDIKVIIAESGEYPLYISYYGEGKIDFKDLIFTDMIKNQKIKTDKEKIYGRVTA